MIKYSLSTARCAILSFLVLTGTACLAQAPVAPKTGVLASIDPAKPSLGINLAGLADWNTELPFTDFARQGRVWISQKEGAPWGKGPTLELDENGYPKRLEAGAWATSPIVTFDGVNGKYPAGRYTVLYDGKGRLDFSGDAKIVESAPGKLGVDVLGLAGFMLHLRETDPTDPVRNIRILMPGITDAKGKNLFSPAFLERWRGVSVLRFMDWMQTNNSKQQTWAERPKVNDYTWATKGTPVEVMVDLANELDADPWFCLPHLADDDYVRNFAQLVKARLEPGRRVYVEYSNELWNGQFEQSRWAGKKGVEMGIADKTWVGSWHYNARRSTEIFKIWDEVYGGREAASKRYVRVLASQGATPYVAEQILGFENAGKNADALSIAAYFSFPYGNTGDFAPEKVAEMTPEQVLEAARTQFIPKILDAVAANRKVADKYGLSLIAYEGGQHFVGVGPAMNNEKLTNLFIATNRHPQMEDAYKQLLEGWSKNGGLFAHFSSVGRTSRFGSWGSLEFANDDPAKAPKYQAIVKWGRAQGQTLSGK